MSSVRRLSLALSLRSSYQVSGLGWTTVGKTREVSVDRRDRRAVEALRIMELV
jgi:hypothetical protein